LPDVFPWFCSWRSFKFREDEGRMRGWSCGEREKFIPTFEVGREQLRNTPLLWSRIQKRSFLRSFRSQVIGVRFCFLMKPTFILSDVQAGT